MRAILAALLLALGGCATPRVSVLMPPTEFRAAPAQAYRVTELSQMNMDTACGYRQGAGVVGCAWPNQNRIFVLRGLSPAERANVLTHEKAHLNGWRHQRQ